MNFLARRFDYAHRTSRLRASENTRMGSLLVLVAALRRGRRKERRKGRSGFMGPRGGFHEF